MNEGDYIRGYKLKHEIGRGSYGDVWLAEKQMDFGGARVYYALKFLRSRRDEGIDIEKVIKEINAWTKASSHANVISIRDSFIEHGKYVIVSDYAEGGSLKNKDFSFKEAARIIEGVLDGIEYLHQIPMIHRDIKPENILLKNGVACISDFGLAREFDRTQSTGLGGSINFFSPEMAKKELENQEHERTPLDDLWAIAVTFYQLIAGEPPFKKLGHIIKCQREPLPADFPAELTEFFNKAFHKNRGRRFQTAKKMREALRQAVYPEGRFENKIEQLKRQTEVLHARLSKSEETAAALRQTVAEERFCIDRLTGTHREIEQRSSAAEEKARKLEDQMEILQSELHNLWAQLEQTEAENVRLKNRLGALKKQYAFQSAKTREEKAAPAMPPVQLEKSFFDAGDNFLDRKEYDQAIFQFTEAIKLNSDNANAYLKRGIAYKGRGAVEGNSEDYDQAIRDYYQATFLKGNNVRLFRRGGTAYENHALELHTDDEASKQSVRDYQRLLKLHPIFNDAHDELVKAKRERRGEILKFMLRWTAVLLAFSGLYVAAYELSRPSASAAVGFLRRSFDNLGTAGETAAFVVLIIAGLATPAAAVVAAAVVLKNALHAHLSERAVLMAFGGVGLMLTGGVLYSLSVTTDRYRAADGCFEKKDYACAVENYTAAIDWSPKYWLTSETEAYNRRGSAYLKMGDVERAVKDYDRAVKLNPNDAKAAENLKLVNNSRQKKSFQE